jgi:ribosomal protein S18 acetylase RimI-like enzyme
MHPSGGATDRSRVVRIEIVEETGAELVEALARLLPQLSTSAAPLSAADLDAIVAADATTLFAAWTDDGIVGVLTLAMFPIPTGVRAWIEDVVVDERARGRGIGEALNRRAIAHARQHGARTVDLTSRPGREAANALYLKLGFVRRDTNVYRLALAPDG